MMQKKNNFVRPLSLPILLVTLFLGLHSAVALVSIQDRLDVNVAYLKSVHDKAFKDVYKNVWSVELEEKVVATFDTYIKEWNINSNMVLITEKENDMLRGWALFKINNDQAILELVCVDPEYCRRGIGKRLVFSILEHYPNISRIGVVTRKINTISPEFYPALGFQKTDFLLPEYNADEIQGYEWIK